MVITSKDNETIKHIKKLKLVFIPLSQYLALVLLLGVCCIYTKGDWFFVPTISVLLGLIIIFAPIYIAKYEVFSKIKKYIAKKTRNPNKIFKNKTTVK